MTRILRSSRHLVVVVMMSSVLTLSGQNNQTVSREKIRQHVAFLASDEMKGRKTNSKEIVAAAKYIKDNLVAFGVKPARAFPTYYQQVPLFETLYPIAGTVSVKGQALATEQFVIWQGCGSRIETGIVFVGYGNDGDFLNKDLAGKIVVSLCGNGADTNPGNWMHYSKAKIRRVTRGNALGLVELYNSNETGWPGMIRQAESEQLLIDDAAVLPHMWINNTGYSQLSNFSTGQKIAITISECVQRKFKSPNVVGVIDGTDPALKDQYLIICAHYDHVGTGKSDSAGDKIYNGARDNGVGVAAVLQAAENIAKAPLSRPVMVVFFTGEEQGLLGSEWFVNHAPVPLRSFMFCLNTDNVTLDDLTSIAPIGLARTTAVEPTRAACKAFGLSVSDDPQLKDFFGRSDNASFAVKGIPSLTFSMGFSPAKAVTDKYYHQPGDHANTLNYDYLVKFTGAYVHLARALGSLKEKVFWTKGDEYFSAGTELYK